MHSIGRLYRLADLAAFWLALTVGFFLRFHSNIIPIFTDVPDFSLYAISALILSPLYVLLLEALGTYQEAHGKLSESEIQNLYRSHIVFYLTILALTFFVRSYEFSRVTLILTFFLHFLFCIVFRFLLVGYQKRLWSLGIGGDRILLIGTDGTLLQEVRDAFRESEPSGYRVVESRLVAGEVVPGATEGIDRIILVGGDWNYNQIADLILETPRRIRIDLIPRYHLFLRHLPFREHVGTFPVLPLNRQILTGWNSFAKRLMDITVSAALLLLFFPILLLTSVVILLRYGRPVLFRQRRVGQNGRLFDIYKFRTMTVDAEQQVAPLVSSGRQANYKWKDDPRVLGAFAWFLRRTSLDELPQFWNVLQGNMSLVGPRPAPLEFVKHYSPFHKLRFAIPPGLTGLQQISCRGSDSMEEILKYDLKYIQQQSLWLDLTILLRTIPALFSGKGVH